MINIESKQIVAGLKISTNFAQNIKFMSSWSQGGQNWRYNNGRAGSQEDADERETRRRFRVERKLQEMQQQQEDNILEHPDVHHDIVEFAHNYFNNHERSPEGTIMATLTRNKKSMEVIPKYEMVTFYKGPSIPTSHVHMYDPDNVNIACNIFRVIHFSLVYSM